MPVLACRQPEAVVLAASIAPEEPDLINDLLDVNNTKHKGSSTISEVCPPPSHPHVQYQINPATFEATGHIAD